MRGIMLEGLPMRFRRMFGWLDSGNGVGKRSGMMEVVASV